jgi:hypothetical protein
MEAVALPTINYARVNNLAPCACKIGGGLGLPIDPAQDFVIKPLQEMQDRNIFSIIGANSNLSSKEQELALNRFVKQQNAEIGAALQQWAESDFELKRIWATRYIVALQANPKQRAPKADDSYGPVQTLAQELLYLAKAGILDGLLTIGVTPYSNDYTLPSLFLGDGAYFKNLTVNEGLNGNRMAISGGTNSYPGQFWLRPVAFIYSIPPFATGNDADIAVFFLMVFLAAGLILFPKIPYLNRVPRVLPFHRVRVRLK